MLAEAQALGQHHGAFQAQLIAIEKQGLQLAALMGQVGLERMPFRSLALLYKRTAGLALLFVWWVLQGDLEINQPKLFELA